ncbi:MAG: cytochrome c3 family protein [Desulfurobacteriaceae bacterium]
MNRKITIGALTLATLLAGCFEGGVLNKDLIFKSENGNVTFSHVYHVKVKKQHCSYCHPKLFKKKFGADKFTMKDIWEGKFCGACHNGSKAFSAKDPKNCSRCHKQKVGEAK